VHIADWLALRSSETPHSSDIKVSAAKAGMQKIKNTLRRKSKATETYAE
jgi:hypothetical protein